MRKKIWKTMTAALALGAMLTVGTICGGRCLAAETGANLIECPNFASDDDISVWYRDRGGATISAQADTEPIYGDVTSYGKITDRSSNYECFSQDVTGLVEKDKDYAYSFYVMLDPVDYADAPAQQRTVEISPYITAGGTTLYSQGCTGTVSQALEPGVWTHFTGVYTPSWSGELEEVVIRILEQGTNYGQGEGVMGTYYMTGMELREQGARESVIQTDVPRLRDALKDVDTMALVTRHFNAITLGNELKPDAMFGYSNNRCPGTETAVLNGEELEVPKLDYSRAEKTLDAIYEWNQNHPEDIIKVRGHVLVWHSQTPEWWFHEDYDAGKAYADTETMNRRLEWYIKTMAEHFTGEDSKYHGMFYGWDVVNEAVSDGGSRYRIASENSSWWAVYQSNEFIVNAFRYANQYMDPEVELYYNDYNEWFPAKREGIVQLLRDVQEAEGTRIDGMGMQGHYQTVGSPTVKEFEDAARAYAAIVGQVQITELDMKASSFYNGTELTRANEFETQGWRYKSLLEKVKSLREEGVNITNITLWGVVDKNSWLQTFNAVGGAADGKQRQCPLLFDDDYMVKPAFWAFADPSRLEETEENEEEPSEEKPAESVPEGVGSQTSGETGSEQPEETISSEENARPEETALPQQPETPRQESSGNALYVVIGVVCAVVAAAVVGIILIRRRKKSGR